MNARKVATIAVGAAVLTPTLALLVFALGMQWFADHFDDLVARATQPPRPPGQLPVVIRRYDGILARYIDEDTSQAERDAAHNAIHEADR
jgi:hypothetical protein